MNNLAENFESIFEAEENKSDILEAEVIEIGSKIYDSLPVIFIDELDGWVRHSLARNGFSDY